MKKTYMIPVMMQVKLTSCKSILTASANIESLKTEEAGESIEGMSRGFFGGYEE